jgi:transposase
MSKPQIYKVVLSDKDRATLEQMTAKGQASVRVLKRAQILLKADGEQLKDAEIAQMLDVSQGTVQNIRENFYKNGLKCLHDKPRPGRPRIIDGDIEAKIVTIACSTPPQGRERWTVRLIAQRLVTLECLEKISHQGVYKRLKKTNSNLG